MILLLQNENLIILGLILKDLRVVPSKEFNHAWPVIIISWIASRKIMINLFLRFCIALLLHYEHFKLLDLLLGKSDLFSFSLRTFGRCLHFLRRNLFLVVRIKSWAEFKVIFSVARHFLNTFHLALHLFHPFSWVLRRYDLLDFCIFCFLLHWVKGLVHPQFISHLENKLVIQ